MAAAWTMATWLGIAQPAIPQQPAPAQPAQPAAAQPAPAANPRNIRFQFDGISYMDVVERFAQMANKPLLADTNIQGTLTFNDPNPYTYLEALDTLNLVLSMKGLMLVESGHYLRLVPFRELPAMPLRILRGADATGDVRPGEVATVVLDVKNLDSKEIADSITTMLSSAGSLAPLSRGRGLIVTDRLANIQRIRTLLATIDTEATVERQMKTYTLLHASGAIVSDLLNRTFGLATAPKRTTYNPNSKAMEVLPPDPNDYVTAVYDDASRTMVLFGPRERIELAEELINKFEQKDGAGGDVRIYYPVTIKSDELANVIRQAVPGVAAPGETASTAATKARLIADNSQNRLIVAAPIPGQLEQIEQLINRVDKPVHGQAGLGNIPLRSQSVQLTKVFRPRAAEATNLASILTQALTRRGPGGQIVTTASVSHDAGSQSVVVSGSAGDIQIATDIVTQLETGTSQPTPLQTRFIDVGSAAEAKRLEPLLEELYRNEVADGSIGAVAHAKILVQPESGRLIVTANETHLARIEELVKQLRQDRGVSRARRLQIIPLKTARVETALTGIQNLVNDKMNDRAFQDVPKPSLLSDPVNNRLLVTATDEQLAEIQQIVSVLDVAPEKSKREMRVVALRAKPAGEVIPMVTQLLEQTAEGPSNPALAPKLIGDQAGKQIVVLAPAKDLARVEQLIQQFDTTQAAAAPRQFKGVELYSRMAADLLPLVQQLYTEQIRGQPEPAGGAATLIAENKSNRIMVSGSEKEITRVEEIIRQLDPAGKKGAKEETRVVRLKAALAAEIATLVEKSLNAQSQQIRVMVDARSNSLVLTGDSAAVEAASQVIAQLDTRSDVQPREMRIIELKQGDASTLASLATTLSVEMIKDQRGPEYSPQSKIVPDATSNRLIVSGPRDELKTVATVVEQLDQSPEASGGARVFKLVNADAAQIVGVVSNAMLKFDARNQPLRRVTVSLDRESNSIVISGSRNDLKDAEAIIQRLDNEGLDPAAGPAAANRARELKIIEVRNEDVDGLAALASRVFTAQNAGRTVTNLVSITADPNTKRLIVLAPAPILPQVEAVVASLDSKADQGVRELYPIDLKNATATDLLPTVTRIYGEQTQGRSGKPASLYADAGGARLMVFGSRDQAAAVRQIVEAIEAQPRAPRETKVFELGKLAEVNRVLPLTQQLYKDQLSSNPQLGAPDAQFVSDGKTGRLIVSARADQLPRVEQIIARLQSGSVTNQAGRETRSFEVGSAADVQRLQPLVQQLYTDQWKEKAESDPADAQILSDTKTGRLIVTGKPEHLKQIEAILTQLGAGAAKPHSDVRDTRILDLSTASAVDLSATVKTLYLEQAKSRFGAQTPDTLITPDAGGNRLIVVGETNELDVIEDIVRKLDKVSAQSATARVFKLKSADPTKVSEILTTALVRYDAYGRPQKRASVSVDAKSRTLIVTGDPKELQGVSVIIEQLDTSLGAQPERKMKVLTLKQGRSGEVLAKVRQLYTDQLTAQPELSTTDVLMMDDPASNQIILAGSDAQLTLIERIVGQLQDAGAGQAARETRFFEVGGSEELARVQPLVQQLYTEQWKDKPASDAADAQILQDPKSGRLIVTARPAHLKAIEGILGTVSINPTNNVPRDTRIYDLTAAQAAELAATVRSLYQEQVKGRSVPVPAQALILPDVAANRLVVSGPTNELNAVEALINRLDKANAQTAGTRVFKLTNSEPDQVASVISSSLARVDPNGRSVPRVTVGADTKSRMVIVSGEPKDLQAASTIVQEFDRLAAREARQMRIIQLKTGAALDLSTKVRSLYLDQMKGRGETAAADALIMADELGNRLLVNANESQLKVIEDILKQLQEGGEGRQVQVVSLNHVNATPLVQMISQLFAQQVASTDPAQRMVVSASPDDRTLLLDAPAPTLTRVQSIIQTLDRSETNGQAVIQTVLLKKATAETLAEAVNRTISARSGQGQLRRVNVTPVSGANALLLNGPNEAVQEVLKIVRELDQESVDGDVEVRIYKLKTADANQLVPVLNQLLQSVATRLAYSRPGTRPLPAATVAVDERANSLLVSGTSAHFKLVEQLLPTLDQAPERSERDVQFVWLKKAKAYDVVSKIEAVFANRPSAERPVVEPDTLNNSITIIAKHADIVQVQDLITRLDETAKDSSLQVRLRPLDRVAAEQMARMLQNIYPQMALGQVRIVEKVQPPKTDSTNAPAAFAPGGANPAGAPAPNPPGGAKPPGGANAPAPAAPATATPAGVVAAAAPAPAPAPAPAAPANAAAANPNANAVANVAAGNAVPGNAAAGTAAAGKPTPSAGSPEVVIAVDKDANALILSGPAQELDHIDRILNELSYSFYGNEAEFRLFPLKEADPIIVARSLTDLLKQEPVQVASQPGQPTITRSQQPRITVVAEPRTRSVIVRARPTDFTFLESLIKQLDSTGQTAQLEFRLVALTNAPPEKVLPLVQQLVTQLGVARPGDPVTVTVDPRSRGLLVVARDSLLVQVEKMIRSLDTPAAYVEGEVLVVSLKKANATQLAAVLQNMLKPSTAGELTAEARELQEQVRRLRIRNDAGQTVLLDLAQPIRIAPDPISAQGGGNRLLLTSTPDNLKALAAVVAMMDTVPLLEGVSLRIVALQFADAASVSQTLSTIFAQGRQLNIGPAGPGAQPEGTNGKALVNPLGVAVDSRSNTLILSGQPETLALAQRVIDDLDRQLDRFVTEVRLFRLKHASAIRLVPLLQSVFAEGAPVPGTEGLNTQVSRLRTIKDAQAPKTTDAAKTRSAMVIQADDTSNILIVAARSDTLPLIEDVIEQLDIPAASGLETVRIYPLSHADPAVIQKILNDIYASPRAATMRAEDKPVITIDARTSALIVAGNGKSFGVLEGLLQQLDQKLPFDLREIRLVPLDNADAASVAATIQKLMDARVTQRATLNQGSADSLKVTILADPRSNSLLVAGGRDSFELVETLARQLDKSGAALSGRIRLIPVVQADARVLAATLTTLFDQRYTAARSADVQRNKPIILADPRSNSLLVTANQEDNLAIDDLLKRLDTKLENPALTLTVIPLKNNDSARVATLLQGIFAARVKAQTLPGQTPVPTEQIDVHPDALNNALVISASKENLELIQGLLQKIDVQPVIEGGQLQTFTLEFADAQRVASILKSLVDQGLYRPGLPAGTTVKGTARDALAISVDPRSNTLIISASPENLAVVREVIRRVDTRDFAAAGDIRMYQLKKARASSLANTLEQYFRARRTADAVAVNSTERAVPVSVIPDDRVNVILITGGKEAFDVADRIIQQLDGESVFARMNFRVFPLKKATAAKLQATLQPIFANRPPKVKGEAPEPITIVADPWVNALLIGAAADDMSSVETLIQQLDADPSDAGLAVHVFPLAKADARRVATTVQSLFREGTPGTALPITVSADERINAIVVSCGDADAKRIAELVKKLDTEQVARVSEIKVFPLRYARAETLSTILNTALNTKPTPLSEQSPNAQSVLQFITRSEQGQELVTAALKEAILITPDGRMNSLIVSGPVDYMGLLEQIIGRLDQSSPQQAKIKVFYLQNADSRQMADLLMSLFRMTPTTAATAGGAQRSIQYTLVRPKHSEAGDVLSEEELASATLGTAEQNALNVTVDPRTNSLLVGGTDHYVTLVSQIIESLDSSPANERKTEVYRLKNSKAQDVALAIRTFLDQERQRVTSALGAEAVGTGQRVLEHEVAVVAEPLSNTLLLSANPRYFEQIRALIEELDKPQQQVLIQVLLAEVTLDQGRDLGLEWTYNGVSYAAGIDISEAKWIASGFSSAVTGGDYHFLLQALETSGRLEVLSRPQIVTADNRPATINIGQRVPLITDSRVTQQGDTINSFRYEDIGVNLSVTPKISPDGFVTMEIGTTNSAISSSSVEINASATVPIINQRRANTTVSVQSGQTIIIGGLIATTDDKRIKKVPVLGDIPVLGYLFSKSQMSRDRKELLILLTPQVLSTALGQGKLLGVDEVTREQLGRSQIKEGIKRDELQKQILDPLFPVPEPPQTPPGKTKAPDHL